MWPLLKIMEVLWLFRTNTFCLLREEMRPSQLVDQEWGHLKVSVLKSAQIRVGGIEICQLAGQLATF